MRRTHLRGHTNILKRLLIHAGGFNLGLVMRHLIGVGTPRGLQGRVAAVLATLSVLINVVRCQLAAMSSSHRLLAVMRGWLTPLTTFAVNLSATATCTTGCQRSCASNRRVKSGGGGQAQLRWQLWRVAPTLACSSSAAPGASTDVRRIRGRGGPEGVPSSAFPARRIR
jgi:hypothetical protein